MPRYPVRPAAHPTVPGGVLAVDRALALLAAFRQGDCALALAELTARTQLVRSTALRLLASLQHAGLVTRLADGRYQLGPEVPRLFGAYIEAYSLDAVVLPALRKLVQATGESAAFHVRHADRRVCLFRVDSQQPLRDNTRVGDIFPLDRGTGGRVLLAYSGEPGPIYDQVRREGVAALVGDRTPELAGISAPVFRAGGELVGAVTLTMPSSRYRPANADAVRAAAREICERLGGRVP